jgi:predicted ribosome quality control (RQC) complex YloA/Tae2 family protein
MDGLAIAALVREWRVRYRGAKIDRIHQPAERQLVLTVRREGTSRLLLSAERGSERAHTLFHGRPDNPQEPPMFCMLARKHLVGGRIRDVRQHEWDRILELVVENVDELGDPATYVLVLELMGKHSNLILCTADARGNPQRIVDSVVRVTPDLSRVRQVLPGLAYQRPPAQERQPIDTLTADQLADLHLGDLVDDKAKSIALVRRVAGVGPVSAREALHRARLLQITEERDGNGDEATRIVRALQALWQATRTGSEAASLGLDEMSRPRACAPFQLTHTPKRQTLASFDEALAAFAADNAQWQAQTGAKAQLTRTLLDQIDRLRGKEAKLQAELADAERHESLRVAGELLTAFAHQVEKGSTEVTLPNFYEENQPLTIRLDPAKSAIENAQAYFKQASKRKRALTLAASELEQTQSDLRYLEECLLHVQDSDSDELTALREELAEQGFLKASRRGAGSGRGGRKSRESNRTRPYTFTSSDGWTIRVGRSNLQNDRLTLRQSAPDDIWLHVKDQPGSHVVIRRQAETVPQQTLAEAALLAAYFSKARDSSNVAVDYTEVRHVWKPSGARPGLVLYNQQRTLFVTPDRSLLRPLLEQEGQPSNS